MPAIRLEGGRPSPALVRWLEQEGFRQEPKESRLNLWVGGSCAPESLPAGPWLVVCEESLEEGQRQAWLAILDEESSLLAPWTPATLRAALRSLALPLAPSLLDSTALARLYAQGGRALADHMVRNFLQHSPELLRQGEACWRKGDLSGWESRRDRLRELAGGVGAGELQELMEGDSPDWNELARQLEAARRVLENQHRQDRTV